MGMDELLRAKARNRTPQWRFATVMAAGLPGPPETAVTFSPKSADTAAVRQPALAHRSGAHERGSVADKTFETKASPQSSPTPSRCQSMNHCGLGNPLSAGLYGCRRGYLS